ncbi:sigma-54-dependent Fis family transcriptional regulator [bacterium]|nr:sigma-54-dependent Fis family transcriptional regulator [bacterium]
MSESNLRKGFRVLVIDDEDSIRKLLKMRLERKGHVVFEAVDGKDALEKSLQVDPEVVVSDIKMPGLNGFDVLSEMKVPTILITGHGDKESAIKAVELGAFSFFEKPFDMDALELSVRRAGERFHMELEREALLKRLEHLCQMQDREIESLESEVVRPHFLGDCPPMMKIKDILTRVSRKQKATVLILGETGTGKEIIAQELHRLSYTNENRVPFLALNCSAIPTELFESELYGHEKGSFSGAHKSRVGLAEAVREGTLFLDEIGELAPQHQAKLLRILQERKFRRVGSNHEIEFKGRIIAATHRNLKDKIANDEFREDLYYRLSIVEIELPALRDRGDDIIKLCERLCQKHHIEGIPPEHMATMRSYPWPGNIRELNNWIERASILDRFDQLELNMGASMSSEDSSNVTNIPNMNGSHDLKELRTQVLDFYDSKWISEALERNHGNISATAQELGIDRKNLSRRIKELALDKAA